MRKVITPPKLTLQQRCCKKVVKGSSIFPALPLVVPALVQRQGQLSPLLLAGGLMVSGLTSQDLSFSQ